LQAVVPDCQGPLRDDAQGPPQPARQQRA
jgi:hypothetical protein